MSDQKINMQFVQEVRKRPLLYNTSLPEYTRRDLTEAAWDEVGKVMNFTGSACKERWKNLRTVYTRHVKRSTGEPSEKRKKYYLTDHMNFILPYMRPTASNQTINSPDSEDACSGIQHNSNAGHYAESLEDSCPDQEEDVIYPYVRIKSDPSEVEYQTSHERMGTIDNSFENDPAPVSDKRIYPRGTKSPGQRVLEKNENLPSLDLNILEARRMFLLGLLDEVAVMSDAQMWSFKRKVLKLIDEVLES